MKLSKKLLLVIPITLFCLLSFTQVQVHADVNETSWVQDNANVLNQNTMNKIDNLNDNQLSKIKGHPQYAVITVNGIPDGQDIDDYAHDQGNELGLGKKSWHNGILFVLDTKNHQYRIEVGTGLQGALPDGDRNQIVTTSVEKELHKRNYNQALPELSDNIVKILKTHQDDIVSPYDLKDEQNIQKAKPILEGLAIIIVIILSRFLFLYWVRLRNKELNQKIKNVVDTHPEVKNQLHKAGLKDENFDSYLNYLTKKDRSQLQASQLANMEMLVTYLIAAYQEDKHPNSIKDRFFGGRSSGGKFFGGGSSSGSSFGDSFGGDSGGFDGGGSDGSF